MTRPDATTLCILYIQRLDYNYNAVVVRFRLQSMLAYMPLKQWRIANIAEADSVTCRKAASTSLSST